MSRRFGRTPTHRKAMFSNMVTSLFLHERILTTLERAKELRRLAEKLITIGKKNDLAARRLAARRLQTTGPKPVAGQGQKQEALTKLFESIAPRFQDRPGGYTRIIRAGNRLGDNAQMAFIELLPDEKRPSAAKEKKTAKKAAKKPATARKAAKGAEKSAKKPAARKAASAAKSDAKGAKKTAKKAAKKPAKKSAKADSE
jgi:large subunit ribosomal protein L17